jgi:L-alanine-DL-glutamate epimerase-like enolase superfamily enzyme
MSGLGMGESIQEKVLKDLSANLAEAERFLRLRDELGYDAFKFRVGKECGHDEDEWPGRTEEIVPEIRKALGKV